MTAPLLAAVASVAPGGDGQDDNAVVVRCLDFTFPLSSSPTIQGLSLTLPRGSRCLLTGANGAGELPPPPCKLWHVFGQRAAGS